MRTRSSFLSLTALSSALLLGACGYSMQSSNQDVTFITSDAQDAECLVSVDKRKYQVVPPQTISVKKSSNDMSITCHTPDSRTVDLTVPAKFKSKAIWGESNSKAWDYASQSTHYYPEVVTIDLGYEDHFLDPIPSYDGDDTMQTDAHLQEEFVPVEPMSKEDQDQSEALLMNPGDDSDDIIIEIEELVEPGANEGSLESVIEELRETPTEVLKESDNANSEPVELFPGQ